MAYIKAVYSDLNQCCDEFVRGVELLEQCSINDSVQYFRRARDSVFESHQLHTKYTSYYGLSLLLNGNESAVDICRKAMLQTPADGDVCLNLARAEVFLSNRYAALKVIEKGLCFSSEHVGLKTLKVSLGVRNRKPLPFLSRANPVSTALGKRMRKKHR